MNRLILSQLLVLFLLGVCQFSVALPDKRPNDIKTNSPGSWNSLPGASGRQSEYRSGDTVEKIDSNKDEGLWMATDESLDTFIFSSSILPDNPKFYPSVGNGHVGHTIYTDSIFVNGIYSGALGWSHRARIPAYHSSNFSIDTIKPECSEGNWTHELDILSGYFTQRISYPGLNLTSRIYAHQFYNRLLVTEVILERKVGCGDCCDDEITINREDLAPLPSTDLDLQPATDYIREEGCAAGECWHRTGTIKEREVPEAPLTPVNIYAHNMPSTYTIPPGTVMRHHYVLSIDESPEVARANFDQALNILTSGTPDELLTNHVTAFNNIWSRGSIEIAGDRHLAKVVHGCLYYLYTSLPAHPTFSPNNQFSGLSPGGLPNGANNTDYQGHVFWDMETWMYPPILMFRPELAADMLSYRISRIAYALERAAQGGYEGARFPWESAFTGVEVTPDICPACRENQQHITGDIAYAARQYISSTWDLNWLQTNQAGTEYTGLEFILEMARFFQSRPKLNPNTGRYDIEGVMPPDEHQENVTNSIYTNVGASYAIHFARFAACLVGQSGLVPDSWIEKAKKLAFTYNSAKQYHEEFEGYDEQVETNTTDPRGVKQADVVMLGFPFLWDMPDEVRKNDHLWYETVTHPNGPAMTWGIYSIGWNDLGDFDKADEMFNKAYLSYAREPFKVWTEVQSGDGAVNFITGMGGFLQSILFGYAGMRLDVTELRFKQPRMLPGANQVSIRNLHYLGMEFNLDISGSMAIITVIKASSRQMYLITSTDSTVLGDGVVKSVVNDSFVIRANPIPNCQISKPEIDVTYGRSSAMTSSVIVMSLVNFVHFIATLFFS